LLWWFRNLTGTWNESGIWSIKLHMCQCDGHVPIVKTTAWTVLAKFVTPTNSPLTRLQIMVMVHVYDPLEEFVNFVLNAFGPKHETILWAHNGGRFDSHFVLQILYRRKLAPKWLWTGLKIYDITVKKNGRSKLHFRDSYLVLQTPLDSLKKTFALDVKKKCSSLTCTVAVKTCTSTLQSCPHWKLHPVNMKLEKHVVLR